MAGEQSSYLLMTQMILGRFLLGLEGREQPWRKEEEIAFLCTVPGFDRHFATLDGFGIKMLTLNLCEDGIDLQHLQESCKRIIISKELFVFLGIQIHLGRSLPIKTSPLFLS